jgi:hypothetical protein
MIYRRYDAGFYSQKLCTVMSFTVSVCILYSYFVCHVSFGQANVCHFYLWSGLVEPNVLFICFIYMYCYFTIATSLPLNMSCY